MLDFLLHTKAITLFFAVASSCLASVLIIDRSIWWRSILFGYGPSFACGFYLMFIFCDCDYSSVDKVAGFVFEFSILVMCTLLLSDAIKRIRIGYEPAVETWLLWTIALQLLAAFPLISTQGVGLFSDGSRIAYFHESSSARFLAYLGVLVGYVQAGLLALRLSAGRPFGLIHYSVILLMFLVSTISGSKGSVFLVLASILALVDYRRFRVRISTIFLIFTVLAVGLWITAVSVSQHLGIDPSSFFDLTISRFFLNNDARALSFQYGGHDTSLLDLSSATFRSIFNFLGYRSSDPPLGLVLNYLETGVSNGNGPNSSLMALFTYYSPRNYVFLPVLTSLFPLYGFYFSIIKFRNRLKSNLCKMSSSLIGIILIQLISQDILAFPLGLSSALAAASLFLFINIPARNV